MISRGRGRRQTFFSPDVANEFDFSELSRAVPSAARRSCCVAYPASALLPTRFFFFLGAQPGLATTTKCRTRVIARARAGTKRKKKKKQIRVTTRHHSGDIPSRNIFETKRTRSDQTEESRSEYQKESENEKDRQCSDARGNSASPELASPRKDGKKYEKKNNKRRHVDEVKKR